VPADPTRILVADDDPVTVRVIRKFLEPMGYEVDDVRDGDHALALAASGDYRVMILDVHMPVYGGVEIMRRLHLLTGRRLKVIAITADRLGTRREDIARMGVDGYLTKPLDLSQLESELRRLLSP
jgi:CheY-like chemotaxis protein